MSNTEWRDFDGTVKSWVHRHPKAFVKWLRTGAKFKKLLSTELKQITDFDADGVIEIERDSRPAIMHIEVQSGDKPEMGDRLMLYNELVSWQYDRLPVWTYLIYLQKVSSYPDNPYIRYMPDGTEIKRLYHTCIHLWELTMSDLRSFGMDDLLPLLPLTADGGEPAAVERLAGELKDRKLYYLLQPTQAFAELSLKGKVKNEWLAETFYMKEDLVDQTWTVQEWMKKGAERERKRLEAEQKRLEAEHKAEQKRLEAERKAELERSLQAQRAALLKVVQTRFPDLLPFANKIVSDVTDPEGLPTTAIVNISLAENGHSVVQELMKLMNQ